VSEDLKIQTALIKKTLHRIAMFAQYEPEIYTCAMIYLDRLLKFQINESSSSTCQMKETEDNLTSPFRKSNFLRKSLIACVFLAGKMFTGHTDKISLNSFAAIVGVEATELSKMESLITTKVFNWNLGIDGDYFRVYQKQLESLF
jgi:hypothetical protein